MPIPPVYTATEVDALLAKYYTSAQVDALLVSAPTPPAPTPPAGNPYPAPGIWTDGIETARIEKFSDCNSAFVPAFQSPVKGVPHLTEIATPYGGGFNVICDDSDVSIWNNQCKDVLLRYDGADALGDVAQWTTQLYLPAQKFSTVGGTQQGWFTGLLWQWHTDTTNPSLLVDVNSSSIKPTPAWRVNIPIDATNTKFQFFYGPAITFDVWHELVVQVRWSTTAAGYYKWYIDGKLFADYSGPTWFRDAGAPYRQWGYYSGIGGVTNAVRHGPNVRRRFAAGLP